MHGADESWMAEALRQARRALAAGEPPIGAALVQDGRLLVAAHNGVISGPDATAHAEIVAIRAGCRQLRSTRLSGCELYVTVEPCPMCLAACHYAGIARVVFGARLADLQARTGTELGGGAPAGLRLQPGVLGDECRALLADWRPPGSG